MESKKIFFQIRCLSRKLAKTLFIGWCALMLQHGFQARAAVDWPTLGFAQVVTNAFTRPTCITHAGDGSQRLFVLEQSGKIWIVQSNAVLPQPFLNITSLVTSTGAEQGLLGLAFPPGFSTNGHFYVSYTIGTSNAVVVSRFQLSATNANVVDPTTEERLLVIPKPFNNHNAGQLAFGPDGYLYIGIGDGGSESDPRILGQNTNLLLSKILRIDVESGVSPYAIPPSNPYVNVPGFAPETWAWGLRNPWKFSFDRQTGDLYIADVGQNMWEEIDFQPAGSSGGQNYGWSIMEGPTNYHVFGFTNFSSLTLPVASYSHISLPGDGTGAVIGGYVYRGPNQPRMNGIYFYGDFTAGWIWGLVNTGTNWQNLPLVTVAPSLPPIPHYSISTFGEDDAGNIYMADFGRGYIYQIQDSGQVCTPAFSVTLVPLVPGGTTIASDLVTVTCPSLNAEIHYTTNGIDPTLSDPLVPASGIIQVSSGLTNKARAFRADLTPSAVASSVYTLQVGTPVFSPPSGAISNNTLVSISTVTPSAAIYYTTNNTTPTTNSLLYGGPVTVSGGYNLQVIGIASGYKDSRSGAASYSTLLAATPTFSPDASVLTGATNVSIECATSGAVIHFTTDGSVPTTNSPIYTAPLPINLPTTLTAVAFRSDLGPSKAKSAFYGFVSYDRTVVTTWAGSTSAGLSNSVGALARFSGPQGICFDASGDLLVGDAGNNVVRLIQPSGQAQTFSGSTLGDQDGPAMNAQFGQTAGVCVDTNGNVYVADGDCDSWRIRKVDTNGMVSTVAYVGSACFTIGLIETDSVGNLYAGFNGSLYQVLFTGTVSNLAGYGGSFVGIGNDNMTNLYIASGHQVWKRAVNGTQTLLAGSSTGAAGYSDGPASMALFQTVQDAAVDASGNVLVTDQTRVRRISPGGLVSTVAGTGVAGYANGLGSMAQFNNATGLCLDTNGNIYVADSGNNCIRKISPDTAGIGIADDWQLAHFDHIGIDPNADPDGDGMSNFQEFWAGTDPLNASSALRINYAQIVNGNAQISWQTVAGKIYTIQYSSDLTTWKNLGSPVTGNGSIMTVADTAAIPANGQRYYRVVLTGF